MVPLKGSTMTESNTAVFRNESQPDWGMGLVVEDGPHHWVLVFERGGRKKFIKAKAKSLAPVRLDATALGTLRAAVLGKRVASADGNPKTKGSQRKTPSRFATFVEQEAFFEKLFIGGFEGERFVAEERGHPEATGKAGYKEAAIKMAQKELSPARFSSGTPPEGPHGRLLVHLADPRGEARVRPHPGSPGARPAKPAGPGPATASGFSQKKITPTPEAARGCAASCGGSGNRTRSQAMRESPLTIRLPRRARACGATRRRDPADASRAAVASHEAQP